MRFTILIYMVGCALFSMVATVKMVWCWWRDDHETAKAIALQADDMANVALNGDADVKISTRIYLSYQRDPHNQKYRLWKLLVDGIFSRLFNEDDHCYKSYLMDRKQGHLDNLRG